MNLTADQRERLELALFLLDPFTYPLKDAEPDHPVTCCCVECLGLPVEDKR